jgi:hypothetical protein
VEGYKKGGKPDIPWWLQQIRLGLAFRKEAAYESKWRMWRNMYRGEWKPGVLPSNVFFKMVRTVVPRIYFRNPSISVISRKPGVEGFLLAKLLERTDNKLIRQMQLKKHMKRQVQDAFMFGTGIGKLGFGSQFHASPEGVGTTEAPLYNEGKESVEYNFDVMPNMPWYARWPVSGYVVPAGTANREDARWECFITRRPLTDLKIDKRLTNVDKIKSASTGFNRQEVGRRDHRDAVEMADLYEIRDKKTGKVIIISPHLNDHTLAMEDDEFLRLGIEVGNTLVFNDDDERFWGIPDSQMLEPLQLQLNEVKTMEMYHRRLSIVRILAQRNSITPEEAIKLIGPDVVPIVWVDGPLDQAVKVMQSATIPTELFQSEAGLRDDVRETLGFSRNEFGEFQGGRESPTATEAQIVKAASEIRVDERRDMVADILVSVTHDINTIIFKHWTEEQVIDVVGPGGIPIWVAFKPAMLKRGKYEISVDPDTSIPMTKELKERKALLVYEQFKLNPLIDPVKLTAYLLHNMHGVAFDDMMRGLPNGAGLSQEQPLGIGQFGKLVQNVNQRAPQLLNGGGRS